MKKKIIATMLAILVFCMLSITAFAAETGDVNGDGKITAADARKTLRHSAGLEILSEEMIAVADVDKSGKVTASDARKILRVSASIDSGFTSEFDGLLVEEGVLNVAVPVENAPFAYTEDGKIKGIDVEIAKRIAETAALEVKFHPMPYDEIFDAVNNGNCDIAMSADEEATATQKLARTKVYYEESVVFIVRDNAEMVNGSQILEDISLKVGVVDNTIEKIIAQTAMQNHNFVSYKTCGNAVTALKNEEVDVLVLRQKHANAVTMEDWDIKSLKYNLHPVDHVIVAADKNAVLAEKISGLMTDKMIADCLSMYDTEYKSKLESSHKTIRIAPGGTAIIDLDADSFYYDTPYIYCISDQTYCGTVVTSGKVTNYFIAVNENAKNEKIEIFIPNEPAKVVIDLIVDEKAAKNYVLSDNSIVPDFGAYTKVTPSTVYIENGIVAFSYNAESVAENGITDTSMLQGYYDALAAAGYEYFGYETIENAVTHVFYNESVERTFSYVEVFGDNGYIVEFGIGFNYNF